ncbi:hypothetical protein BU25DRAFT_271596 [Macroventuria anomochaeta]|uniref:Uncharacterized protein n=1 Tax=Macroventuria anomochaeta TaxID=301207 RepID=A0ACB6S8J4_9PLEO|nr:uncharacterized protein BU25DRAFT_271596 [Macroventuria anomochaeta]KAF2629669.1 hypothetical protein BU25DRAFT_271596 [Macroventuria anomochaeta]
MHLREALNMLPLWGLGTQALKADEHMWFENCAGEHQLNLVIVPSFVGVGIGGRILRSIAVFGNGGRCRTQSSERDTAMRFLLHVTEDVTDRITQDRVIFE